MRADFILETEKRNTIPLPLWSLNPPGDEFPPIYRSSDFKDVRMGRAGSCLLTLDRVDTAFDRAAARSKIDPK